MAPLLIQNNVFACLIKYKFQFLCYSSLCEAFVLAQFCLILHVWTKTFGFSVSCISKYVLNGFKNLEYPVMEHTGHQFSGQA
jgi:hypothetical protein